MKRALLLLLLLIPFISAEEFIFDSSLYSAEDLVVDISLHSTVTTSGNINSLTATTYYVPQEGPYQDVESLVASPEAQQTTKALVFTWSNPRSQESFSYQSQVHSTFAFPKIHEQILFPYASIPPQISEYLDSQEIIRITPEIETQANSIVGDEDDAVRVVFALGKWTKDNIEYDLNTVTAEASQTSEWVLQERRGVCDELTSLFIAMVRSQGIPARFVSGIAYTNLESIDTNWGPHGWAEVWFPDVGWIPYDVTYGQYGFVDATHIVFLRGSDAAQSAVEYSYRSRNGQIKVGELRRDTQVREVGKQIPLPYEIMVDVALDDVGFGSFNRVDVEVENTQNHYIATEIFLAKTAQLDAEDYSRSVLLAPREKRVIHWLVEVDENLRAGYSYTFPVAVYTNTGSQFSSQFHVQEGNIAASRDELLIAEEKDVIALDGNLQCSYPKEVLLGEEFLITCSFDEKGELCIKTCSDEGVVQDTFAFSELGAHTIIAHASRYGKEQRKILTVQIVDVPNLSVDIDGPLTLGFSETGELIITVHKESFAPADDVVVTLMHPLYEQKWELIRVGADQELRADLFGRDLTYGDNEVTVQVEYGDKIVSDNLRIHAVSEGFTQNVYLLLNSLSSLFVS